LFIGLGKHRAVFPIVFVFIEVDGHATALLQVIIPFSWKTDLF
jgi:hypothetical protein